MTNARLAGSTAVCALLLATSPAVADSRLGAEVGVNAGYTSNPFGANTNNAGAATLAGTFSPTLTILSPTGSTSLTGSVTHTEYARLYDGTTDYSVGASTNQQVSATTSLTGRVGYSSQVRNSLYPIADPITGLPNNPNAPVIVDPSGALSFAERIETISGNVGITTALSARDTISLSGQVTSAIFPTTSVAARSYDVYGGSASYMRRISANTSVGLGLNVARSDYRRTALGDTTQISPSAILQTKLNSRLSLRVAAGLTFSNIDLVTGKRHNTAFYGNGNLCYEGLRSSLCADASQSVSPTATSGTSTVTSFGAAYNYKLTARSNMSARLSYSTAKTLDLLGNGKSDFGQASLSYNRQITERLSGVISASYSDTFNSNVSRNASFYGTVGIRYRLGTL